MAIEQGSTAWCSMADELFLSLTESQRKQIVQLSSDAGQLGATLVAKAVAMAAPAGGLGGSRDALEALCCAAETGPAFVAFGMRAVDLEYLSQKQLDAVVLRLVSIQDPMEREAETVKAMRRFLCTLQPLGGNIRVRPNCKTFKKSTGRSGERCFDLNGMELSIDGTAPPGGDPERYNVLLEEDAEGCQDILEIEPKYLRPCPMYECEGRDEYHEPIPEDHRADEWWEGIMKHHEACELMYQRTGQRFGPERPSGPGPQ